MRVDIVTLFPELFEAFLRTSFVGKATANGQLETRLRSPRDFGLGKHKSVDDTPYGGGSGMVMRVDVVVACLESLDADAEKEGKPRARRVLLTPQGRPFVQSIATAFSTEQALVLICGRYEGFDERIRSFVDDEISLGDFVMTGGEVAAMAVVEATVRLIPGVLGNEESTHEESHGEAGLLEYPHYTRPAEFRGQGVPEVLSSGNHARVAAWRSEQSLERTRVRRPDLAERLAKKP
ncbi:MAG TPA: tRNA (guanosine(37)-N1)-methyltransferase TrmD [Labilithrix sp.]|nr:tRNA (guanosine(37)-N1)-methyltransferase TrmD [Labilithrix sp.]